MRTSIATLTCLLALMLTGTASAAVPGLNLVVAGSGPPDSASVHVARAQCPAGQEILGLGGKSEGGGGQVVLDAFVPTNDRLVTVRGHEDQSGFAGDWAVKAYAICADQGAARRITTGPLDSFSPKFKSTLDGGECTAEQRLTGTGGEIPVGATGQVMLTEMVPANDLESVTARAQEDQDGFAGDWSVRPYALCLDLPGLELVTARSASNSQNKHATAVCPSGKRVVGTGGRIFGSGGEVSIQYMVPDAALTRVHVRGVEDQDGRSANWTVTAYAICATA